MSPPSLTISRTVSIALETYRYDEDATEAAPFLACTETNWDDSAYDRTNSRK